MGLMYSDCEELSMQRFEKILGRKIRIGVVGCGRISANHLRAISQFAEDFELVSACDIDEAALQQVKQDYGINGYADLHQMLESENLDAVVLCTPSGLHPRQAILAAQHGVNVISEKPMATRYEDGECL